MFSLVVIKDSVRIAPAKLSFELEEAVVDELNAKYCNKVIPRCGLAVAVFDVEQMGDAHVNAGDASANICTTFRLIVFRPFNGQIITGKVRSCDEQAGIHVTLGFFDDILVPPGLMPEGTRWDANERVWVWSVDGGDMFIDPEEPIRIRVLSEIFIETAPTPKEVLLLSLAASQAAGSDGPVPPPTPPLSNLAGNPPYRLIASIAEDGLGLVSWWEA